MEKKNSMTFTMIIIAFIVGSALYKQFNFETHTFEKKYLSLLYAITFLVAATIIIKNFIKKSEK